MTAARRLVSVNRALWMAAAGVAAVSLMVAGYWTLQRWMSEPKPLEIPAVDAVAVGGAVAAVIPQRNPFDPTGAAWQAAAAVGDKKQVVGLQDVRGVLASNIVSGVFTNTGLIRTGEPFGGGTLEKVSREELVLRMPDGTTKSLQLAQRDDDKVRGGLLQLFDRPERQ